MAPVADRLALDAAQTRRRPGPRHAAFQTTADVAPLHGTIGQTAGRPAGPRNGDGAYPESSVHRLVDERPHDSAVRLRAFGPTSPDGGRDAPAPHRT